MSLPLTWGWLGLLAATVHVAGMLHAVHAIMTVRTAQGTLAWVISLVTFPYLAIPLYWVFGRSHFNGYIEARRAGDESIHHLSDRMLSQTLDYRSDQASLPSPFRSLERLASLPFTRGNDVQLLVDGQATFEAVFAAIDAARHYVLAQFFIVHDDELGRAFADRLMARARAGVRVYLLYDEIGSHALPERYIHTLREAGVDVRPFKTTRGPSNRFQLNFRNHRKIVVADGEVALIGGLNVGDEYMGRSKRFGPWRDTHVRVTGPAVQSIQLSFVEDWHWATGSLPGLNWVPHRSPQADRSVLIVPTSPADDLETCDLLFVQAIHSARHRLWLTSPYFVPDSSVLTALQLAGLRGVDVRIMLPQRPDHLLVYLSAFSFLPLIEKTRINIYRYQPGFLHQKVMLVDDAVAAVGTANLDNRSFRLNFELTALVADADFASKVEAMLLRDFAQCEKVRADELKGRSALFRFGVRAARLLAPIQ